MTTYRNAAASVTLVFFATLLRFSLQKNPCVDYTALSEEKRSVRYTAGPKEPNLSDQDINEALWYRFKVLPPSKLHDRCVAPLHCGTDTPVFINGAHPTLSAQNPGPTDVGVCAPQGNDCCGDWRATVKVRYCPPPAPGQQDFYVYRLKRVPRRDMAYCAGDRIVCPPNQVFNPNSDACSQPKPPIANAVFAGPIIEDKRETRSGGKAFADFKFTCAIQPTAVAPDGARKGLRFDVVFTFDGQEVPSHPPVAIVDSNQILALWSKDLTGQIGKTVGCKVRSYWNNIDSSRNDYSPAKDSHFVGIRYSTNKDGPFNNPQIALNENSPPLTLYFKPTVPVSCPDEDRVTSCKLTVDIDDISDTDGFGVGECEMVFSGLDTGVEGSNLTVKALPTPGFRQRTTTIRFKAVSIRYKYFWEDYKVPNILVSVVDSSKIHECSSVGDPHFRTFDGRVYHSYTEGDYRLIDISTPRRFQVHVRHSFAYSEKASTNCAIAVREGNNAIGLFQCQAPYRPTPIIYLKDISVPGANITNVGNTYTIRMPSGAYVNVVSRFPSPYIDVYAYLSTEYVNRTSGLCGNFNGIPMDDKMPMHAHKVGVPDTVTPDFRLTPKESLINGHLNGGPECFKPENPPPNICGCSTRKAIACKPTQTNTMAETTTYETPFARKCEKKPDTLGGGVNAGSDKVKPQRRRRDANRNVTNDDEVEDYSKVMIITEEDIPLPEFNEAAGVNVTQTWPTPSGVTEEEARRRCLEKTQSFAVYQLCSNQLGQHRQQVESIISNCIIDYQLTDNEALATASAVDSFQALCLLTMENAVETNGSSSTPSKAEIDLKRVLGDICPGQCNGKGTCRDGKCACQEGFAGDDCSVEAQKPPQLQAFRKNKPCDSRTFFCTEISIFAANFYRSDNLVCKIVDIERQTNYMFNGSMMSSQELACELPLVHRITNRTLKYPSVPPAPVYRWNVAVANDGGNLYSNALEMLVYDSRCQDCTVEGKCQQKRNTCLIDGRCYLPDQVSPFNSCHKCVPSTNEKHWTAGVDEKCSSSISGAASRLEVIGLMMLFCLLLDRVIF